MTINIQQWSDQLPLKNIQVFEERQSGDVNQAYYIQAQDQEYFLLVRPNESVHFYDNEILSLKTISEAGIAVPKVIDSGTIQKNAYLLLSFLTEGSGSQKDLGRTIAKLHQNTSPNGKYGFDLDHTGSTMTFNNKWTNSWTELFIERRLDKMVEPLMERNLWSQQDKDKYLKARSIMIKHLDNRNISPSLLHGDFWGGNHMFLKDGTPALFDPTSFYGDREFDLGMASGFGAFNQSFYESYNEAYPLDEGWQDRLSFYSLYMFMVHLLKFGPIYYGSVDRDLNHILSMD